MLFIIEAVCVNYDIENVYHFSYDVANIQHFQSCEHYSYRAFSQCDKICEELLFYLRES